MPVLQPAELWQRTGRYGLDEQFELKDRRGADLVLAMTHEENVTFHVSKVVRSYRDLPLILYHVQTKERDEPRPRAGVLRTREFIMKDSYTFDRDADGLQHGYDLHIQAYDRIFDRCGLEWYRVESDVGMMGGLGAHEYMAPCPAGENDVALSASGYAANMEVASATAQPCRRPVAEAQPRGRRHAGSDHDRGRLADARRAAGRADQGVPRHRRRARPGARPDARRPSPERRQAAKRARPGLPSGAGGGGRVGVRLGARVHRPGRRARARSSRTRRSRASRAWSRARTSADKHVRGVEPGRDFDPEWADVRTVEAGDTDPSGAEIRIEPAIEIGNIFKLGTRYSRAAGRDLPGRERQGAADLDGLLRHRPGPDRGRGRRAVRRRAGHLVAPLARAVGRGARDARQGGRAGAGGGGSPLRRAAGGRPRGPLRRPRGERGREVRRRRARWACPLRLTVGKRGIEQGEVEAQVRRGQEKRSLPLDGAAQAAADLWRELD